MSTHREPVVGMAGAVAAPAGTPPVAGGRVSVEQAAIVVFGALAVALVFVGAGPGRSPTVLAAGSAFGAAALVLVALRNMEHFVVATLVLRTALDGLHVRGHAASTDPATVLGALFVVVSLLWLAARRAEGRRHPLSATGVALVAFLIAVGLATLGSEAPVHSLAEAARLATAVLMFFVVDRLCEDTGRPHHIVLAILAAAVVPLTVALAGPLVGFHRTEMKDGISRIISTFAQSNPFGHFLTIVVLILGAYVLVRRGREQWLALAALAPVGLALVLTYTRLAWAGAVVGVLVMVWVAGRRWLAPTLLVVLVGAAALTPGIGHRLDQLTSGTVPGAESGTDWRLGQWAEVARLGGHNPVTGIGPNVVALRLANHQPPHNDYLRAFVELGFVGMVAFVGLLAALIALAITAQRQAVGPRARTIALAFVGVISGYVVASVAANLLGQVVLLWYVFALAASAAWVARHRAVVDDSTAGQPAGLGRAHLVAVDRE